MRRREFITLLGGAAVAWPLAARAQQRGDADDRVPWLGRTVRLGTCWTPLSCSGCAKLGWIEGRTVTIEYRWAEGAASASPRSRLSWSRLKVDVIVTWTERRPARPCRRLTLSRSSSRSAGDPVGRGVSRAGAAGRQRHRPVASVSRSCWQAARTAARGGSCMRRLAILANAASLQAVRNAARFRAAAARSVLKSSRSKSASRGHRARVRSLKGRADALYVCGDPLVNSQSQIKFRALRARACRRSRVAGVSRSGRSDVLRTTFADLYPARRRLCRQDPARGQARRPSGRAADQIRSALST